MAVWFGLGLRTPVEAGDRRGSAGQIQIDAIFVERTPAWWLVDEGARRATTPRWVADARTTREFGAESARVVLDAIETGEGGGYADETGLGPPAPPAPETACGIRLVASARDVAVVFLRDERGQMRVLRASRLVESGRVASPTTIAPLRGHDPPDALEAARRRALLGDATETLRLVGVARARAPPSDIASLDIIEAQALERLGRFREAGDALARFADRWAADGRADGTRGRNDDSSLSTDVAIEARRQAARVRVRVRADGAAFRSAPESGSDLDAMLAELPRRVIAGQTLEGVARAADAVRNQAGAPMRSLARRRALLAAAALAVAASDPASAHLLLAPVAAGPLSDALAPLFDALMARADAMTSSRARASDSPTGAPGPPVGKPRSGG